MKKIIIIIVVIVIAVVVLGYMGYQNMQPRSTILSVSDCSEKLYGEKALCELRVRFSGNDGVSTMLPPGELDSLYEANKPDLNRLVGEISEKYNPVNYRIFLIHDFSTRARNDEWIGKVFTAASNNLQRLILDQSDNIIVRRELISLLPRDHQLSGNRDVSQLFETLKSSLNTETDLLAFAALHQLQGTMVNFDQIKAVGIITEFPDGYKEHVSMRPLTLLRALYLLQANKVSNSKIVEATQYFCASPEIKSNTAVLNYEINYQTIFYRVCSQK